MQNKDSSVIKFYQEVHLDLIQINTFSILEIF